MMPSTPMSVASASSRVSNRVGRSPGLTPGRLADKDPEQMNEHAELADKLRGSIRIDYGKPYLGPSDRAGPSTVISAVGPKSHAQSSPTPAPSGTVASQMDALLSSPLGLGNAAKVAHEMRVEQQLAHALENPQTMAAERCPLARPGQNYLVLCTLPGAGRYTRPDGTVDPTPRSAFRPSAVFATEVDALAHAKDLSARCPFYDVQVVAMAEWGVVPFPELDPTQNDVRRYASDAMGKIMKDAFTMARMARDRTQQLREEAMDQAANPKPLQALPEEVEYAQQKRLASMPLTGPPRQ